MSQTLTQNVADQLIVLLTKDDVAVTGLTFSDVAASLRKEGGSFAAKTLDATNFTEVGSGVYEITLDAADLDTEGTLVLVVTGATIDQSTTIAEVSATPAVGTTVSIETCVITGHVLNGQGVPLVGAAVSARVVGMPSIEQSVAALSTDEVTAQTDSNGQFFIELVRLADVEVTIPLANYRRRLVVPDAASANLFEIP